MRGNRKLPCVVCGVLTRVFLFFFLFGSPTFSFFFLSVPVRTRDAGCGRSCAESLLAKRVGAAVPWVKVYIFQLLAFILERPESCPGCDRMNNRYKLAPQPFFFFFFCLSDIQVYTLQGISLGEIPRYIIDVDMVLYVRVNADTMICSYILC